MQVTEENRNEAPQDGSNRTPSDQLRDLYDADQDMVLH